VLGTAQNVVTMEAVAVLQVGLQSELFLLFLYIPQVCVSLLTQSPEGLRKLGTLWAVE